ncbi:MAG: hypothetical protein ABEH47_01685 [Haloferacaceae archaeon]
MSEHGPGRPRAERRWLVGGGVGAITAILGFAAVQAIVRATDAPSDWVLLAMPLFGLLGAVSLVLFAAAFLVPRDAESDSF